MASGEHTRVYCTCNLLDVGHKKGLGCDLCGLGFSRQKPSRSDFKNGCETSEKEETESDIAYLKTVETLLREDHTSVNDTEVPADTDFQVILHFLELAPGAQWLSGRVLDLRPRGCGFEPHRRHCVVVLEQDTFILT